MLKIIGKFNLSIGQFACSILTKSGELAEFDASIFPALEEETQIIIDSIISETIKQETISIPVEEKNIATDSPVIV